MSVYVPRLVLPTDPGRDHIRGPVNARLTLLEYGDFECPYCGAAHPVVDEIRRRLGRHLRFVFRHFPLSTVHPHAELAAEAAEAAGAQGKFWEMHDRLFEHQAALGNDDLIAHGTALDLDIDALTRELADGTYAQRVREDFTTGVRSGVNGTPSFFINNVRYDGSHDLGSMLNTLEGMLRAA